MDVFLYVLYGLVGLPALVCYAVVVRRMSQRKRKGLARACVWLLPVLGLGFWMAFVFGWVKANEWRLQAVMLVWSLLLIAGFLLYTVAPPPFLEPAPQAPDRPNGAESRPAAPQALIRLGDVLQRESLVHRLHVGARRPAFNHRCGGFRTRPEGRRAGKLVAR